MTELTLAYLLGANVGALCLSAVCLNRARRHAHRAALSAASAATERATANDFADRAAEDAGRALSQATRAAREATRAVNASAAMRPPAPEPECDGADVIPFRRPRAKATGPRLADLDDAS